MKWLVVLALGFCVACGGSGESGGDGSTPPPPPPPTGIGAAGGTVTEASGAKVVIPANALTAATDIKVTQTSAGAPALPASVTAFGPIYAFTPHGTSFAAPVTITVPFDPANVPAGTSPTFYKTDGTLSTWAVVTGATVDGNTMSGEVTGFSDVVVGSKPPPALEKGNPQRDLIVISNPLDHSRGEVIDAKIINVGLVDLPYDFGPADMIDPFGPLPDILPLHPRATGRIFSSPGGGSYGVSGEAPVATAPKDPAGQFSNLIQSQSFRIKDKSAKLRVKITLARIEAFDSRAAEPPPCAIDPTNPLLNDLCNGQMTALVHVSVSAGNARFSHQFQGYLLLQGWRGHWTPVKQAPFLDRLSGPPVEQLWTPDKVDFDEDVGSNDGRQAHLGLNGPLIVPIDLETDSPDFKKDEVFTMRVEVTTETYNGRPGSVDGLPSYLGAFFRDPTLTDGNAEIITEGLEPTDNPQPPTPDPDLPAECLAKPVAGTLQFAAPGYSVLEGSGAAGLDVMVLRSGGRAGQVSASLSTHDGTATAPGDFQAVQTTVTFVDGDATPQFIHIPLVYSTNAEGDKNFTVTLSGPTGCASLGLSTTSVIIIDDTRPVPLPRIFSLGGTVSGLEGTGLTLRTDAFDQVQPGGNGPFTFPVLQTDGTAYSVSVAAQPANPVQTCTVTNGSGTIAGANVTNIQVSCVTPPPQSGLDPSFGSQGKVFTVNGSARVLAQQADGKLLALGSLTLTRYNTDGTPDTSFGTAGKVDVATGGAQTDRMMALTIQRDGKILLVGNTQLPTVPNIDFIVLRLNANGTPDTTFGTGGKVITDFEGARDEATGVMLQLDGKIVVTGDAQIKKIVDEGPIHVQTFDQEFALTRYLPDGTLDTSFGTNGKTTLDAGGLDTANAAAMPPDDSIIMVGRVTVKDGSGNPDMVVARFLANGSPDTGFGTGGVERIDVGTGVVPSNFNGGNTDQALDVAVQANGKILVAGDNFVLVNNQFVSVAAMFRLSSTGAIEQNFGPSVPTTIVSINGLAVQQDGKIVITGPAGGEFGLARFNADGALDTSFGTGGLLTVDFFGAVDEAFDVLVQADGRIVAGGTARNGTGGGAGIVRVVP